MRKSRLSQYKQNKLIELFVAGVTARIAAELTNVNKSTAAYYFHRLRLLITKTAAIWKCLTAKWKQTKAILADTAKANAVVALQGKPQYSVY